jgi:hypothetical protein
MLGKTVTRVAKPYRWNLPGKRQIAEDALQKAKKGPTYPEMLKGLDIKQGAY